MHPRVLVDIVLLLATSAPQAPPYLHHLTLFIEGFQQTLTFFTDLGAKVSPTKSLTFSSCAPTRTTLRNVIWTPIQATIQVLNDNRDLGTHISALSTLRGTTLTRRLHDTADIIYKQRNIPLTKTHRNLITTTKYLPRALYGCETRPINESALAHFRSSVALGLGNHSTSRSLDIVFTIASLGKQTDIDPLVQVLVRRCRLL